jgi:hypothetical protein
VPSLAWDAALHVLRVFLLRRRKSVIEMTHSALRSVLGSEFDNFLFAPIGEDRNDMPLSVLSAFARLDIDPWQEVAELARLPRKTATQRLASLIAALPGQPTAHLEPGAISVRLIALLPRQANSNILPRRTLVDAGDLTKFRAGVYMYAVFIVIMLGAQWIAASRQTPTPVGGVHTPASGTVLPRTPPPNSGR